MFPLRFAAYENIHRSCSFCRVVILIAIDSDPLFVSGALTEAIGYIKASNTGTDDAFGSPVTLSADGNTLAVGAFEDSSAIGINGDQADNSSQLSGAVYVFTRTGSVWEQQAYIKASNTNDFDRFGRSVSFVQDGDILVTDMTDPDWEPVMKRAAGIVTNRGGRTCHAAIIARELGVPAVVGCGDATAKLKEDVEVTVCCAEGDTGKVYEGKLEYKVHEVQLDVLPELPFKIMLNVGNPERAFDFQRLPNHGVGLMRLEFMISNTIGVHPKALLNYDMMDGPVREQIDRKISGYDSPTDFYVKKLTEGIATLASAFRPHPVIVRLSDFKSNEYSNLIGGELFEPDEENPMIGFRGASRYVSSSFRECFELECNALKTVRDEMGLINVWIMVPFVRTLQEADDVLAALKENGLERGSNNLKIVMMCEVPSNAILADEFLEKFDGFSIGSNDLTQLTLGLDRDSGLIAQLFDERDPAVKSLLASTIAAANRAGKYIGICGQGPSDHPDLAKWLMEQGISSVSLNPDTVVETWSFLANRA